MAVGLHLAYRFWCGGKSTRDFGSFDSVWPEAGLPLASGEDFEGIVSDHGIKVKPLRCPSIDPFGRVQFLGC